MTVYTTLLDASTNKMHVFVVQRGDQLFVECGLCRFELNWNPTDRHWFCVNPECGTPYIPAEPSEVSQSALNIRHNEEVRQVRWIEAWTGLVYARDFSFKIEWMP